MPTENLSEQRTLAPPQTPPQLKALLLQLDQALCGGQSEEASRAILRSLDFMLRYFTGVSTGLLASLEPGRPEVQTLSAGLDSVERYERLLRFSMAALENHREDPSWRSLRRVFYREDEESEPHPRRHTRWLKLAAPGLEEVPPLSAWAAELHERGRGPHGTDQDVRLYGPILEEWLTAAADFFETWEHAYRPDADGSSMQVLLEHRDFEFQLIPPLKLQPISEDPQPEIGPAARLSLEKRSSPLQIPTRSSLDPRRARPRQEADTGRTLELRPQQVSRKQRSRSAAGGAAVPDQQFLHDSLPPLLRQFLDYAGLPRPEDSVDSEEETPLPGLEPAHPPGFIRPDPRLFQHFLAYAGIQRELDRLSSGTAEPREVAEPAALFAAFLTHCALCRPAPPTLLHQFLERSGTAANDPGPARPDPAGLLKSFFRFSGIQVPAPPDLLERFLRHAHIPEPEAPPASQDRVPPAFPPGNAVSPRFPVPITEPEELESPRFRSPEPEGTPLAMLPVPVTEPEELASYRFPVPSTEPEELETAEGRRSFVRPPRPAPAPIPVPQTEREPAAPPPPREPEDARELAVPIVPDMPPESLERATPTREMLPEDEEPLRSEPDRLDEELAELPDLSEEHLEHERPGPGERSRARVVLPSQEFLERARRGRFRLGKPWTQEEVEVFEEALSELYAPPGAEHQPLYLTRDLMELLAARRSGYVLLEGPEGSGKTFLARTLVEFAPRSLPQTVVHFPISQRMHGDYETLLEIFNEHVQVDRSSRSRPLRALAYQVLRDLNRRYPEDCARRFSSYLSALSLANDERPLVLFLDGLDELFEGATTGISVVDFLPEELPEGIFLVLAYRPGGLPPRLAARLEQLRESGAALLEIEPASDDNRQLLDAHLTALEPERGWSEETRRLLRERGEGRLAMVCHLANAHASGIFPRLPDVPPAAEFYDAFTAVVEKRFGDRFIPLFLLLATSFEPVTIEEIAAFGARRDDLIELLHNLPSLFAHSSRRGRAELTLAQESFREYLRANYVARYSRVCEQLTSLALPELKALDPVERPERLRTTLDRLHLWALDSQDEELMAQVAGSTEVVEIREQVCAALGAQHRFHQKVLIRDGQRALLEALVEGFEREEFREELAWAHSSRGLTYHRLGQFDRALVDIEKAIELFRILVEEEGQEELRNGLAAAYNRRSEAYRHKNLPGHALEDADLAVEEYSRVIEEQKRDDLRNLLALSLANRAESHRQRGAFSRSRRDFDDAVALYSRLVEVEQQVHLRAELAQVLHSRSCLALQQGDLEQAERDVDRALGLFTTLTEEELYEEYRNDLASAHNDRASIYHRAGRFPEALEEYGKAIEIRQELVAEGRLDVRPDLARALTNRGIVLASQGDPASALEEHEHALEILTRLTDDETRHDLVPLRGFAHFCRGGAYRALNMLDEASQDYQLAVAQYLSVPEQLPPGASTELAAAYCSLGAVSLDLGDLEEATRACGCGIEVYRGLPGRAQAELQVEQAVAHNNRGEAYRKLGANTCAREEYDAAVALYAKLVESGRGDLISDLALAHSNRAGVAVDLQEHELAARDCSRAIALFTRLVEEDGRQDLEHYLARAYDRRAATCLAREQLSQALEDVSQAVVSYANLVDAREMVAFEDELAGAHRLRGRILGAVGEFLQALRDFDRAEQLYRRLWEREPAAGWSGELARTILMRSQAYTSLGETGAAVQDVVAAFELSPRLVNLEEITALQNLLSTLRQRAVRLSREEQLEAASDDFADIIELCRSVMNQEPRSDLAADLAHAYNHRGWIRLKEGDPAAALADFDAALQAYAELEDPVEIADDHAWAHNNRATAMEALGRLDEAVREHGRAIELYERQLEDESPPAGALARLATGLEKRCALLLQKGETSAAWEDACRLVRLRHEIAQRDDRPGNLVSLATSHQSRASLAETLGRAADARQDYDAAIEIYSRISEEDERPHQRLELIRCLLARGAVAEPGVQDPDAVRALERAVRAVSRMFRHREPGAETYPAAFLSQGLALLERGLAGEPLLEALIEMGLAVDEHGEDPRSWAGQAELYLKIAFRLPDDPGGKKAYFVTLASLFCGREVVTYGQQSIPRLVRCLFLLGKALRSNPIPPFLERVGPCFDLLAEELTHYRPVQELEVEINNLAKFWQSLPATIPARAKVPRARLTSIRRW
ncbi:MAG: tetratricopeptide repeat protein [Armatimonadetes bacterium]|nr:tetratricopeptide repeat protein [Armatimonadota bacterium]